MRAWLERAIQRGIFGIVPVRNAVGDRVAFGMDISIAPVVPNPDDLIIFYDHRTNKWIGLGVSEPARSNAGSQVKVVL
tara:strand:+ start:1579 stop:1812 length:234 start_codon:yes stop_codon:yes gene_type:complete